MTTFPTTVQEQITLPAAPGPNGSEDRGGGPVGAGEVLAMLRRRTVLIVVMFLVLSVLLAGGFAALWVYFPGYRAEALIECISNVPDVELTVGQERLQKDEHERFVKSQALLMVSPSILGETLKVSAVRETEWYRSVESDKHMLELEDDLRAAPVRGTNFLRVSMSTRVPRDGALIVNEVVNQWLRAVRKRTAEEFADPSLGAFLAERDDLNLELAALRKSKKDIVDRLPPGAVQNPGGNISHQQVAQFAEQAAATQLELSQLEQYRVVYNDPQGLAVTADDRAAVEQDPQVAELSRQRFLLEQQLAADAGNFGVKHSERKRIEAQLAVTEQELVALRLERLGEQQANNREVVNTAHENSRYALFQIQERLLLAEGVLQDQDRLLNDYQDLQSQELRLLEYSQTLDQAIKGLTRIKTLRTAIKVNIAQEAIPPLRRSSPQLLLAPICILLALAMSLGLGLGLELMDQSVRTSQDVVRHLDAALLGLIPHTDDEEVAIRNVETAFRDTPQSMVAEAFRRIRTNLQFSAPVERQRTVLVTSPQPEDGKTTVACNLALSLAQGGRRVLLIDTNFRRPTVHRVFDNSNESGLSNLLIGEGALKSTIAKTSTASLDVLASGPTPPNPVELLDSPQFRSVLRDASAEYDQVIIDSAPVLLASDASVLASLVDGVVLVVRAKRNSRGAARRAGQLLGAAGAHMFGVVLNAAQVDRGGYFREQLRSYYDYQEAAGLPGGDRPIVPTKRKPPVA